VILVQQLGAPRQETRNVRQCIIFWKLFNLPPSDG
jgi:hypothetical protein